ncbi:MAG: hypothetical protein HW405_497 [Candidatus Berkelbacteria bacterium]|nr:hypothetical protein [Candidatus Berkelbacteria bacterium]
MTLSNKDIGEIVGTKITKEIGFLRLEMNQRFDKTDQKIDDVHKDLSKKIEEVNKMENEDIQALATDIVKIKKKIAFQQ